MGQTRVEEKEAVESRKSGDGEGQGGTEEAGNPFVLKLVPSMINRGE